MSNTDRKWVVIGTTRHGVNITRNPDFTLASKDRTRSAGSGSGFRYHESLPGTRPMKFSITPCPETGRHWTEVKNRD